jgi:hypothetical protein
MEAGHIGLICSNGRGAIEMQRIITEIEWHDASILEVNMQSFQDAFDRLSMRLQSDAFMKDFGKQEIQLVFKDCYKIRTELNLWMKGHDSISEVNFLSSSPWIEEERNRFVNGFGPKALSHFIITLNSNSRIEFLLTHNDCVDLEPN